MDPDRQAAKSAKDAKNVSVSIHTEPGLELDHLAHEVIGAAIELHRVLGPGLLESVYEEAFAWNSV